MYLVKNLFTTKGLKVYLLHFASILLLQSTPSQFLFAVFMYVVSVLKDYVLYISRFVFAVFYISFMFSLGTL